MPFLSASLLMLFVWNAGAQQKRDEEHPEGKWEVLDGCQLVTNTAIDGDSFRVTHKEREYIFRLYFVDTPETEPSLTERAQDQAAYFGISTNDIPRAGELAGQFTREKLAGREFTVVTRWQNAMGRSKLARFYCVVLADGKNVGEELVAHGLARIYGPRANWPDGPRSVTFINTLKNKELVAREQKRGLWNELLFPRTDGAAVSATPATNSTATSSSRAEPLVDLNTASFQELQKLPGIGPKFAERIIAHRPYQRVDDLDKVPGVGPKTVERLRPFVRIEEAKGSR